VSFTCGHAQSHRKEIPWISRFQFAAEEAEILRCQIGTSSLVTAIGVTCPTFSLSKRVSQIGLLAPLGKSRAHFRGVGIFDLLANGECLFGVLDGLSALAELAQR